MHSPYTYESVEYSDGYYHTVFSADGVKVKDFPTEEAAKSFCETLNDITTKGLGESL